jgi:two-component system response regulator NreC
MEGPRAINSLSDVNRDSTDPLRAIVADDDPLARHMVKSILQDAGIVVVAEAGSGREATELTLFYSPDVVLMDVVMPGKSGIDGLPALLQALPDVRVLMLSMQDDPRYVREAFEAGASGYVLKEAADTDVVEAVRVVASGERYVHPTLGARLVAAESEERKRAESDPLSEREREVLKLLALGHTNQEIAALLYISVRTAETHRAHIMQKLGLSSRAELVRYALDHGLVDR